MCLLAGMERISVDLGQFVVTGEPVAVMGGGGLRLRRPSRLVQANRCFTLSFERTGPPSIQAHGGRQAKAKRFADDAQDFTHSPRCGGRRGLDADHDPAPHRVRRFEREGGGGRHLPAAQPVRRRVRAGARRLCGEARRRQAGRIGDQRHAGRARSAFELHGRQELPRHAGADARRVRRPRHRGHHGGRPDQGGGADRRDAGRQGRRHGQRHHHPSRRRAGAGPHPQPGGRQDARAGEHQDQAQDHAQGPGQAGRDVDHPRRHPGALGALACRRATTSAISASPSSTSRPPKA